MSGQKFQNEKMNLHENPNIKEAKKSIKHHIKFLESLKDHITRGQEPMLSRSMWASWCLHRYINDKLVEDIQKAMEENKDSNENK